MNIKVRDILQGPYWPEKVRVISVKPVGGSGQYIKVECVGVETKQFYDPILSKEQLKEVRITEQKPCRFTGEGEGVFLFIEANRIRNAFLFDPLYAVNISQIDPLPHQIEAVYHYILRNPRIRFLLADDPGAGKTIMAGLLLKELKYRGLIERTIIVTPGHLKDQWLREMKEKFQETFTVVTRETIRNEWGRNVFNTYNQVIVSMDFAKQDDVMSALKDSNWDLAIVDEAHKLAAYRYGAKIDKTQRYNFGEQLSPSTTYLLFLTATPHRGDPENFRLLLDLLEPGFFANTTMLAESIQNKDNPLFLRRLKEDLKDFDGRPLFTPRKVKTVAYELSSDEKQLYDKVTEYIQKYYNKALSGDKRNVTFALLILQRRMASSVRAIRKSLERRHNRLQELHKKGELIQAGEYSEETIEDLTEQERWKEEEELLEKLTSADTLDELKEEIDLLDKLVNLAREVEKKEIETKLNELKKVIVSERLRETGTKLLIFTESKDTLEYLSEKIRKWGYTVTVIHGGMDLDARIRAEHEFRHNAQIMVSTEAGGEGINLQFCWLMVNYDIPWNPNRLEQRMGRIHRYGQTKEVHIYNLVAINTREGMVLNKVFEKLARIREHYGSDRVFDVIDEVLVGKSLKDLIVEAIANLRSMDDILRDIDAIPDKGAIESVRKASMEALATRHIDLGRILGEQRVALENRLVPEYIEEFFRRAANKFNIRFEKRSDGLWRIDSVPYEIRNRPRSFIDRFGEVRNEYTKVSFDKWQAQKSQAEFVSMGHPLLEAVIETIFARYKQFAEEGAVFIDLNGNMDGVIWFLEAEIKDGSDKIAGKRLFAVFQNNRKELSLIHPAILWDLKPGNGSDYSSEIDLEKDAIIEFAINTVLERYRAELLETRQRDAQIKEKYGIRSLDAMISESDAKLTEYETRRLKGENIPDVTIRNEERRKEDLVNKRERLKREIQDEIHLYPSEPRLLGVIRVIPQKPEGDITSDPEIEKIGMEIAMKYEQDQGRIPEDVSALNLGYDIRSQESENYRYIEVKARAGEGAIVLTPNEWLMAHRLGKEYWLYVVTNAATNPELYRIQNPAEKLVPEEVVDIVRYVVKNWKDKAE